MEEIFKQLPDITCGKLAAILNWDSFSQALQRERGCRLPALLREDALGANGGVDLGNLLGGAHQQGRPRVGNRLAAALAGVGGAASNVNGIQVKLPVGAPRHWRPASGEVCGAFALPISTLGFLTAGSFRPLKDCYIFLSTMPAQERV